LQTLERMVLSVLLVLATGAGQAFLVEPGARATNEAQPVLEAAFAFLYLALLVTMLRKYRKTALAFLRCEKLSLALAAWALLSAAWSVDVGSTLRRAWALVGTSIAGLYFGMNYDPKQQLKSIALPVGLGAIASLAAGLLVPGTGIGYDGAWLGIYSAKNALGRMMALGTIAFVLLAMAERRGRAARIALSVLCCVLMALSRSATAIVVTAAMLALFPFRNVVYLRSRRLFAAFAVLIPAALGAGLYLAAYAEEILQALHRTWSLSGRLPLWQLVFKEIGLRPILGYGFTAFWTSWEGERVSDAAAWDVAVPHAHNGFLEVWLGLGVVGLAILLLSLSRNLVLALRFMRSHREVENAWPLLIIVFSVLYNLTESSFLAVNSLLWMAYISASFGLARDAYRENPGLESEPDREPAFSA
jgi:exopolysaccharide production protein ExoQ